MSTTELRVETMTAPVVSTAHIEPGELQRLNESTSTDTHPFAALSWAYGWLIYCADFEPVDDRCDLYPHLCAALAKADAQGFEWIRFDCDAEEFPEFLPVFDHAAEPEPVPELRTRAERERLADHAESERAATEDL